MFRSPLLLSPTPLSGFSPFLFSLFLALLLGLPRPPPPLRVVPLRCRGLRCPRLRPARPHGPQTLTRPLQDASRHRRIGGGPPCRYSRTPVPWVTPAPSHSGPRRPPTRIRKRVDRRVLSHSFFGFFRPDSLLLLSEHLHMIALPFLLRLLCLHDGFHSHCSAPPLPTRSVPFSTR